MGVYATVGIQGASKGVRVLTVVSLWLVWLVERTWVRWAPERAEMVGELPSLRERAVPSQPSKRANGLGERRYPRRDDGKRDREKMVCVSSSGSCNSG